MKYTKEQREALIRLLRKEVEGMSNMTKAVYISPAQQLRNRANEIEQEERDTIYLREILTALLTNQT